MTHWQVIKFYCIFYNIVNKWSVKIRPRKKNIGTKLWQGRGQKLKENESDPNLNHLLWRTSIIHISSTSLTKENVQTTEKKQRVPPLILHGWIFPCSAISYCANIITFCWSASRLYIHRRMMLESQNVPLRWKREGERKDE